MTMLGPTPRGRLPDELVDVLLELLGPSDRQNYNSIKFKWSDWKNQNCFDVHVVVQIKFQ